MKTKDLIQKLQEEDPTGELEVTCGKADIYYLSKEPAYYDGCTHILVRDPALEGKCYNIIGVEIRSQGQVLVLNHMSAWDCIMNDPDVPVTYDCESTKENYEKRVENNRRESREIWNEVHKDKVQDDPGS